MQSHCSITKLGLSVARRYLHQVGVMCLTESPPWQRTHNVPTMHEPMHVPPCMYETSISSGCYVFDRVTTMHLVWQRTHNVSTMHEPMNVPPCIYDIYISSEGYAFDRVRSTTHHVTTMHCMHLYSDSNCCHCADKRSLILTHHNDYKALCLPTVWDTHCCCCCSHGAMAAGVKLSFAGQGRHGDRLSLASK